MPQYDFDGTVAFVTGGARGQGRSHAVHFAEHGADVVVVDRCANLETVPYDLGTREALDETVEKIEDHGSRALAVEGDVTSEEDIERAVQMAVDEFGHIDVLANNAGIMSIGETVELDERTWQEMIDTNLKGVWLCSKHVGSHMIERGIDGSIISTASNSALVGMPLLGHYAAAKHGVVGLTKTLALELAEYDINVNCICPSGADTEMIHGSIEALGGDPFERMTAVGGPNNVFDPDELIPPEAVSEAYLWLASDASRYVTGTALPVDAGYTAK
jgi:SDR family mycofactocin-dependent oxidoreductase